MKVLRIEDDKKRCAGCFILWVWARDDDIWKECAYAFKYETRQVHFVVGGSLHDDRLVGEAESKDDAIKKAELYLEGWLRECGAID